MLDSQFLKVYSPMVAAGHKAEKIAAKLGQNWTGKRVFEFAADIRNRYRQEAGLFVIQRQRIRELSDAQIEEIYNRAIKYVPACVSDEVEQERNDWQATLDMFAKMAEM